MSTSAPAPLPMKSPTSRWLYSSHCSTGLRFSRNGCSCCEHRRGAVEHVAQRGQAGLRRRDQRVEVAEEVLEVRRQRARVLQRRLEVAHRRAQLAHQRVGVLGERLQLGERRLGLVQERREDLERLGQRLLLLLRGASKTSDEFVIRSCSCASFWFSAPNTTPVSFTSRCTSPRSARRAPSARRRRPAAKPGRLPNASLRSLPRESARPHRPCASDCCQFWNAVRVTGSSAWKISSSWTVFCTCESASQPSSGIFGRLRVARRQLDVGLAQQRLLAQDRAGVLRAAARTCCRARASRPSGSGARGSTSFLTTLPTDTPATRTSASSPSCVASGNATFTR